MKKLILIIPGVLIAFALTLSFANPNNFGLHFANWALSGDPQVKPEKVMKKVRELVVDPIRTGITKRNPGLLMTKCFSSIESDIYGHRNPEEIAQLSFYKSNPVEGQVFLNRCGREEAICRYRLNLETEKVLVKESFLGEWITLEYFLQKMEQGSEKE
ncbi:MAG: hypothetical protein EP338_03260 [Bacteroidetes bacterium]|nr:MAG: hypothetical protein EP338_03260 [Bacteroidota bacterium]